MLFGLVAAYYTIGFVAGAYAMIQNDIVNIDEAKNIVNELIETNIAPLRNFIQQTRNE